MEKKEKYVNHHRQQKFQLASWSCKCPSRVSENNRIRIQFGSNYVSGKTRSRSRSPFFFTPDPETDKPDMDHGKNSGSHWIRIPIRYPANHFISDSLNSKPNWVFKLKWWISFLKDHTEMIFKGSASNVYK